MVVATTIAVTTTVIMTMTATTTMIMTMAATKTMIMTVVAHTNMTKNMTINMATIFKEGQKRHFSLKMIKKVTKSLFALLL